MLGNIIINELSGTYIPLQDLNGFDIIEYQIFDGENLSDIHEIIITINPSNDAPVLDDIVVQETDEDVTFIYSLLAVDVDGDDLEYIASIDGNGSVLVDGNTLTITPDANYNGSIVVDVSVTDGQYTDSNSFVLTVNAVNDAPVL